MDFLNPRRKKARKIQLIIGYVLIAIAIALVTAILVFQSYGYDLDRKTGAIIQNGLLVVSTQPEQADVYLNGKLYKSNSDAKLVLPSDVYQLQLKRNGYQDWNRTVSLAGGSIERFVYPFIWPANLATKQQKTYADVPLLASQSPDRHWILIQQPGQVAAFDQFDANDSKKEPTVVTIPPTVISAGTDHQLKVVEWSTDNRHVLLQHDYSGGREFIVFDRDTPSDSYNVTKALNVKPTEVTLRDKHFDQLYLWDQASQKLDFGDQRDGSIKPVLAGVLAFKPHGSDLVLYTTGTDAAEGKARLMIHDKDGNYLLREVPAGPKYLLDLAEYSGHFFMAGGTASDDRVYVFKDAFNFVKGDNPKAVVPESILRVKAPGWIGISANAQSIAIQGGSQFSVYDAENARTYRYDLKLPLDPGAPDAHWMDGHRLIINSSGKMVVVDFDGTNLHSLTPNQPGMPPFFDRQYKLLYNLAPNVSKPGQFDLTRLNLVVGENK